MTSETPHPPSSSSPAFRPVIFWGGKREIGLARVVLRQIPKGRGRLLEVGCAEGYLLHLLTQQREYALVGSELAEARVARARTRVPEARIDRHDIVTGPPEAEAFEVVVCCETIEHIERLQEACRNLVAALKPGGLLIVTVPNEEDLAAKTVKCPHCRQAFHPDGHLHSFTPSLLRSLFEPALQTVRVESFHVYTSALGWFLMRVRPTPGSYLLYVGRKPAADTAA